MDFDVFQAKLFVFANDAVIEHERIHAAPAKRAEGLLRCVHNRLAFQIEGGIEKQRHSRSFSESLDKPVVPGVGGFVYCLQSACSIHVRDRRNDFSFVFFNTHDIQHEAGGIVASRFRQDEEGVRLLFKD